MILGIFRHGEAYYKQAITTLGEANDLTENGRRVVEKNAIRYLNNLDVNEAVVISSPYGRTLETAGILVRHLQSLGIKLRGESDSLVRVRKCLQEQQYPFTLLRSLATGGEIVVDGTILLLEREVTNSKKIEVDQFAVADAKELLTKEDSVPSNLKEIIRRMETAKGAGDRIERLVKNIGKFGGEYLVVLVTHEALIREFLSRNNYKKMKVDPGEAVMADLIDGNLVVRRIAGELVRTTV